MGLTGRTGLGKRVQIQCGVEVAVMGSVKRTVRVERVES